jgi:hypothetical protein
MQNFNLYNMQKIVDKYKQKPFTKNILLKECSYYKLICK